MNFAYHLFGGGPVDAAIGDRDAVFELVERLREGLVAGPEVALDHRTHNRGVARRDLAEQSLHDLRLKLGFLGRVVVGAVDENRLRQAGLGKELFG